MISIIILLLFFINQSLCLSKGPEECPFKAQIGQQNFPLPDLLANFKVEAQNIHLQPGEYYPFSETQANPDSGAQKINLGVPQGCPFKAPEGQKNPPLPEGVTNSNVEAQHIPLELGENYPLPDAEINPSSGAQKIDSAVPHGCPFQAQKDQENTPRSEVRASSSVKAQNAHPSLGENHPPPAEKEDSNSGAHKIEPEVLQECPFKAQIDHQNLPFPEVGTSPKMGAQNIQLNLGENHPSSNLAETSNPGAQKIVVTGKQGPPFFNLGTSTNAEPLKIDVTGEHKFTPPGPEDQRGPCPGLNALANHNYLPHNGVATIPEFVEATNTVFGMGRDLGTLLAVYGAVVNGNLYSWSIGGPSKRVTLGSLFSQPQGLSFSHNKFEGDASATRGDLYQYGDASKLQLSQFGDLYAMTNESYDTGVMNAFLTKRLAQSKRENPYFFFAPISGPLVTVGAYQFVYRFMGNKSKEYPEGKLNREVLKSFYAVGGTDKNLTYTPGNERIPDNWYRYPKGQEYTLISFFRDLTNAALRHPEILEIGGNTGKVDSFVGIDISRLTGGTYNVNSLLQGNNLACYAFQVAQETMPDIFKGFFSAMISAVLAVINTVFSAASPSLRCPQLSDYNSSLLLIYPGYTGLQNGSYEAPHPPQP
ncbi:uncharacterized protein [Bemisia tabaci]|uniref:uncharacterized protein n=1 Tax=Bemisia tabaci TaxID=7038 RepID=UPI003B28A17B